VGKTCTVITPIESVAEIRSVVWDDLHGADYRFATPFIIELDQGEFFAEEIVRLVPGRRMVAFGSWRGVPVAVKLFYDRKHAARQLNADVAGVKAMIENKIPTPDIRYEGLALDKKTQVLIFDRLLQSKNLEDLWQTRTTDQALQSILEDVIVEMATQHVLGVMQKDTHMGNFLIEGKTIYTLDGAQIETRDAMLAKAESMENLALFLSQLGAGVEPLQEHLFCYYAKTRGWLLKPRDMHEIQALIKECNDTRWKKFEKKIFRNCTDFVVTKNLLLRGMLRRDHSGPQFDEFIHHPDAVFKRDDIVMLKDGGSSTVIKVVLDGRELVVKRYNIKNFWHRLRRAFRVTRAEKSWRLAQRLNLFYINTPKPVAYLETNVAGVRGKSYIVTEYVYGSDLKQYLAPYESSSYSVLHIIKRTVDLLRSLAKLEITHGDLKATNIIINEHLQPVLIDLDGAAEHFSLIGLRKAWRLELKRFMRNFDDLPAIREVFRRSLRKGSKKKFPF
jgi:tRNA A-37 threonylcarbamoyl transferase component Bud32